MTELAAVFLALLVAALVLLRRKRGQPFAEPRTKPVAASTLTAFEARRSLFVNRSELAMFQALERAVPSTHRVMAKTRLEDIIGVRRGVSGEARWKLRARVKSRHVDFLVVDRGGHPCVAVELDGASHDAAAHNADQLKNGLFAHVGIPLVRVRVGEDFTARAREIARALNRT